MDWLLVRFGESEQVQADITELDYNNFTTS